MLESSSKLTIKYHHDQARDVSRSKIMLRFRNLFVIHANMGHLPAVQAYLYIFPRDQWIACLYGHKALFVG